MYIIMNVMSMMRFAMWLAPRPPNKTAMRIRTDALYPLLLILSYSAAAASFTALPIRFNIQ
jgi:hypothetical protein